MGTVTGGSIISSAQRILQDLTGVRWPVETELLGWLNDGQYATVIIKPNAYVLNESVKLVAGTRQSLPVGGIQLVDVICNMGTAGNTPGRAIRLTDRETLDAQVPAWHAATASPTVKHYIYNPLDPKHFYVYPPQPTTGQGYVQMAHAGTPTALASSSDTIALDDIYHGALMDYILYRAFSKDTEVADQARAASFKNSFITTLTGKSAVEAGYNPNVTAPANIAQRPAA